MISEIRRGSLPMIAIALCAMGTSYIVAVSAFSPVVIAFCIAMLISFTLPVGEQKRTDYANIGRLAARCAVGLLGLKVSLPEIMSLRGTALPIILGSLALTFFGTIWLGRMMKIPEDLVILIAAGSAICGASAILAVGSARGSKEQDTAYAVACMTILGMGGMLILMAGSTFLALSPYEFGVWSGASLQEVAQVLGATGSNSVAQTVATISKIARILFLPVVIFLSVSRLSSRSKTQTRTNKIESIYSVPGFIFCFAACATLQSIGLVPEFIWPATSSLINFLLAIALAGLAFGAKVEVVRELGWRPIVLAVAAAVFISCFSLAAILLSRD